MFAMIISIIAIVGIALAAVASIYISGSNPVDTASIQATNSASQVKNKISQTADAISTSNAQYTLDTTKGIAFVNLTMDANGTTGIVSTKGGLNELAVINLDSKSTAVAGQTSKFALKKSNFTYYNGTGSAVGSALIVPNMKVSVCEALVNSNQGTTNYAASTSVKTAAEFLDGATTAIDVSAATSDRMEGCVKPASAPDATYGIYYKVLGGL